MFKRKSHVSKSSYWYYVNKNESNSIKLVDLLKNFIERIFDIKIIKKKILIITLRLNLILNQKK